MRYHFDGDFNPELIKAEIEAVYPRARVRATPASLDILGMDVNSKKLEGIIKKHDSSKLTDHQIRKNQIQEEFPKRLIGADLLEVGMEDVLPILRAVLTAVGALDDQGKIKDPTDWL